MVESETFITNLTSSKTGERNERKNRNLEPFIPKPTSRTLPRSSVDILPQVEPEKEISGPNQFNRRHPQTKKQIKRFPNPEKYVENKPFISSIFNKNPDIPHLPKSYVQPIKETVFVPSAFEELELHSFIISNLKKSFNINHMTAVQEKAIPSMLDGKDLLVKSQTGSGKTLAYAVPLIQMLQSKSPPIDRSSGIFAVIILPTRELTIQTFECFQKLVKPFARIVPGFFIGGQKRKSEKASIRKGINIIISTPGRLLDHIQHTNNLKLDGVEWLILDEADRLMDMGYEKDVASIIEKLGKERQTVMLSATLTQGVEKLAGISLKNPLLIDIAVETQGTSERDQLVTPENLEQFYILVPAKLRLVTLATFILWKCAKLHHKLLVFMPTQDMVDYHTSLFRVTLKLTDDQNAETTSDAEKLKTYINCLYGDMAQQERTDVFRSFREATSGILLCTDVASRGLDLPLVDWIVQYGAPSTASDYVHRVGRTARIGTKGHSLLFLLPSEAGYVNALAQHQLRLQEMVVESILEMLPTPSEETGGNFSRGKRKKDTGFIEEMAMDLQLKFENALLGDEGLHEQAKKAFLSFVRSYYTYKSSLRHIFPKNELHLGHVAKSLALRDTPSSLGANMNNMRTEATSTGFEKRRSTATSSGGGAGRKALAEGAVATTQGNKRSYGTAFQNKPRIKSATSKMAMLSEFSSGLDEIVDPRTTAVGKRERKLLKSNKKRQNSKARKK